MKILHVHKYYYPRAGAERYMLGLMRMQEEAGHTVAPFVMHHPKNLPSPWSEFFVSEENTEGRFAFGLRSVKQAVRAFWSWEARRKMHAMLDTFRPDIVHVHNIYTHLSPSVLQACKSREIPVVMTVHDFGLFSANYALWDGKKAIDPEDVTLGKVVKSKYIKGSTLATLFLELIVRVQRIFRLYDRNIDKYIAISHHMKKALIQLGIHEEKVHVQYNYADTHFTPAKKKERYVLFVGRLDVAKGVSTLIQAMSQYDVIPLKIAGTGPDETVFRKQARNMDNVEFLGFVEGKELEVLYERARVVVVPSIWNEPFGLVTVEAMAKGAPVIVSDKGALPEIVEDHISGRIFTAGNSHELALILRDFLKSEEYARSIGEVAYKRAKKIADPQEHLQAIMEEYKEIIDTNPS